MNPATRLALQLRCTLLAPWRRRRVRAMCRDGTAAMNVLFYHRVADHHSNGWTIDPANFERHIRYCDQHFQWADLEQVQQRVASGVNSRPTATITFDDGYAENMDFAIPLLATMNVPTVYFVATAHVIHGRPFPHDVAAGMPLTVNTTRQIRDASDAGIEIGLHTRHHADFSQVRDAKTIEDEIIHGKQELEDMIGREVRYFAVPFGLPKQLTPAVIDVTRRAGLRGFCSAFGAYNLPGRDDFHIRRFHGDPCFARLRNWLSFDAGKVQREPTLDTSIVLPPNDGVLPPSEALRAQGITSSFPLPTTR